MDKYTQLTITRAEAKEAQRDADVEWYEKEEQELVDSFTPTIRDMVKQNKLDLEQARQETAREIIEELEPARRGPYAGLVGYFSFNGNFDSCITIRTMLVTGAKVFVQAGAGIVADSVPENEYSETLNKAKALFRAIQMARGGSV